MLLARNWWMFLIRGVLALIFGIVAILFPATAFISLVLIFGAFAFVDGVFALIAGIIAKSENWLWLILEGVIGIFIGVVTLVQPSAMGEACETKQISVFEGQDPIAISYFDVGERSCSGVYAIFEPAHSERRLGIFTMLKEIEYAIAERKEFYYQGYAYQGESFYDYKKRFRGTEFFDWKGNWPPGVRE